MVVACSRNNQSGVNADVYADVETSSDEDDHSLVSDRARTDRNAQLCQSVGMSCDVGDDEVSLMGGHSPLQVSDLVERACIIFQLRTSLLRK